jgi:hypothetical protein
MSDDEATRFQQRLNNADIAPLLTAQSDIESYFISHDHLHALNPSISAARIRQLIDQATQETTTRSVEVIVNLRTEEAFKRRQGGGPQPNFGAIAVNAQSDYAGEPATYRRGKIVMGRLVSLLQQELGENPRIYFPSDYLKHQDIASIAASIWDVER